jgi:hypothetical protein
MDDKHRKLLLDELRHCLRQVALELEAAASAANQAADGIPSEVTAWRPVQQLYTRLDEANHLATQFKEKINEAVQQGEHAV